MERVGFFKDKNDGMESYMGQEILLEIRFFFKWD